MKEISNVKVHLRSCSGNVNIYQYVNNKGTDQPVQKALAKFGQRLRCLLNGCYLHKCFPKYSEDLQICTNNHF